jgi:hypothetical protein
VQYATRLPMPASLLKLALGTLCRNTWQTKLFQPLAAGGAEEERREEI